MEKFQIPQKQHSDEAHSCKIVAVIVAVIHTFVLTLQPKDWQQLFQGLPH